MGFGFFQGDKIKILKDKLSLNDAAVIDGSQIDPSTVLITDSNNNVLSSDITSTELGYLDGVTANIQTQLNSVTPNPNDQALTSFSVSSAVTNNIITLNAGINSIAMHWSLIGATDYQAGNTIAVQSDAGVWQYSNTIAGSSNFGGVNLEITTAGVVRLVNPSVTGTFRYRFIVT